MEKKTLHILIIEDSKVSAQKFKDFLNSDSDYNYIITHENSWEKSKKIISNQIFECIILDNLLPDAQGTKILSEIKELSPNAPVILITGKGSESTAVEAMKNGAADYLLKKNLDKEILKRAVHNAIDKTMMINELDKIKQDKKHDDEVKILDILSKTIKTSVTAQLFGYLPIKQSIPELFEEFVEEYKSIMDFSVEEKAVKVSYNISEKLRLLAQKIGFHRGVPKDIIDIHSTGLKEKIGDCPVAKAKAFMEEGRYLVLELMGFLALYYRNYALGASRFTKNNEEKNQGG